MRKVKQKKRTRIQDPVIGAFGRDIAGLIYRELFRLHIAHVNVEYHGTIRLTHAGSIAVMRKRGAILCNYRKVGESWQPIRSIRLAGDVVCTLPRTYWAIKEMY